MYNGPDQAVPEAKRNEMKSLLSARSVSEPRMSLALSIDDRNDTMYQPVGYKTSVVYHSNESTATCSLLLLISGIL